MHGYPPTAVWPPRPSIAPEQLLRAQWLQILYTIRSERQLMEQLDYHLLFRWFVGLNSFFRSLLEGSSSPSGGWPGGGRHPGSTKVQ
jgi:hypothetical protein